MDNWLRSFSPWLASILLDVAVGGDVVQDPAHVGFIISKKPNSTSPTVILIFSMAALFWLQPTVDESHVYIYIFRFRFLSIDHYREKQWCRVQGK